MTFITTYNEVTISPMNTGEYEPQAAGIWRIQMGEARKEVLPVHFDSRIKLEFHGAAVTSDAGSLPPRESPGSPRQGEKVREVVGVTGGAGKQRNMARRRSRAKSYGKYRHKETL